MSFVPHQGSVVLQHWPWSRQQWQLLNTATEEAVMVTAGQVLSFSPLGWGKLSTQGFLKNILKKMAVQDENGSIYVFTPSSGEKLWKKDIDLQFEA
eukprot:4404630-Lingulodinium_polyedra.AAC.1